MLQVRGHKLFFAPLQYCLSINLDAVGTLVTDDVMGILLQVSKIIDCLLHNALIIMCAVKGTGFTLHKQYDNNYEF